MKTLIIPEEHLMKLENSIERKLKILLNFALINMLIIGLLAGFIVFRGVNAKKAEEEPTRANIEVKPSKKEELLAFARSFLDTPYVFGKFDCSEYVRRVYAKVGIFLPRVSTQQYVYVMGILPKITDKEILEVLTMLMFFDTGWTLRKPNHVGIETKPGWMIHNSSKKGVVEVELTEYWQKRIYRPGGIQEKVIKFLESKIGA